MKYEVEIIGTEPEELLDLLSKSFRKVAVTPIHEIYGKQNMLVYNERTPEPSYSRAQVLCEKYEPITGETCFGISATNRIIIYENLSIASHEATKKLGYVFAPSKELAEEIVQIRLGKWLPKKGDDCFPYSSRTKQRYWEHINVCEDFTEDKRFEQTTHYFPCAKQRDTFIEKQKEKETLTKAQIKLHGLSPEEYYALHPIFPAKIHGKEIYIENGFLKVR